MNVRMAAKIFNGLVISVATGMIIFVGGVGYCANDYLFSSDGNYQVGDSNYKIVKEGNIYSETISNVREMENKHILGTEIWKVFYSEEANIIFFLIGEGQANKYYGFMIFQLATMKFLHFLELEINLSESPVNLLIYKKTNRFYLSYWNTGKKNHITLETKAYDLKSFELLQTYNNQKFIIDERSCIVDDKLFNGHFFNISTGEGITMAGLSSGVVVYGIYDCKNGYALGRSSSTIKEPITLVLIDLNATTISKKEIKTDERIIGLNISNEWYLSRDARYIIRDEQKEDGRTGRLVFIDVEGKKKTELYIPRKSPYGGGILGFSLSGKLLFYDSIDKLNVIDIQTQKVIKEILLPFRPVGIIWP
jgi:hypothetical protein